MWDLQAARDQLSLRIEQLLKPRTSLLQVSGSTTLLPSPTQTSSAPCSALTSRWIMSRVQRLLSNCTYFCFIKGESEESQVRWSGCSGSLANLAEHSA